VGADVSAPALCDVRVGGVPRRVAFHADRRGRAAVLLVGRFRLTVPQLVLHVPVVQ